MDILLDILHELGTLGLRACSCEQLVSVDLNTNIVLKHIWNVTYNTDLVLIFLEVDNGEVDVAVTCDNHVIFALQTKCALHFG